MALQKLSVPRIYADKGLDSPIEIYWRITAIHGDIPSQTSYISLSGYASKEARDAGKEPIEVRTIYLNAEKPKPPIYDESGVEIPQDPPVNKFLFRPEVLAMKDINPVMFAYLQVKENDFFKDAEDV